MVGRRITPLVLGLALFATAPAWAQPAGDPFEAIVADREGADVKLNDVAIPARNPTQDELRQYLEAFRVVNLSANFTVDDGTRRSNANVLVPAGEALLGPFAVPNGTQVRLAAGFTKRPGETEGVLRTLEMIPTNPMALGPLRFNKMTLDGNGVLHLALNLKVMGFDFWPQELTIEKIYRDAEGNTVFKTGGTGLAGKFVPDIRIKPDGTVQRYSKGWVFGLFGKGWKDLESDGKKVTVPATIPIDRWPPRTTDLLHWMPQPTGAPTAPDSEVPPIPITAMNVNFVADADARRIALSNGEGYLDLSNHRMEVVTNGKFDGRDYVSDATKRNDFHASATVSGEVNRPGMGRAKIDRLELNVEGDHSARVTFDHPEETELSVGMRAHARADLRDVELGLPGTPTVKARDGAHASFDGDARLTLYPNKPGTAAEKKELAISPESRYGFSVDGPVTLSNLGSVAPAGVTLPDSITVRPADDPTTTVDESAGPTFAMDGNLGTRMGFVFARTDIALHGETATDGAIGVLTGEGANRTELRTTLKEGASVHLDTYAFAGIKENTLVGGGVRVTPDLRIHGTGEGTVVRGNGLEANLPGVVDVDARVAANVRQGTTEGNVTEVRAVAAEAHVTMREGEGTVTAGLPGGPVLSGRVGEGTRFDLSTGTLRRADVHGSTLETDGYADGRKAARLSAHLVLVGGSVAQRDLALAFSGRTEVDLALALGFRVDPRAAAGQPASRDPIAMDLDLGVRFAAGSSLRMNQNGTASSNTLRLRGETSFTLHAEAKVDPSTGTPTLAGLDAVDVTLEANGFDLRQVLGASANTVAVDSRSTVRLKKARVELLPKGIRIHHQGIVIEVAAGTIDVGFGN